MTRHDDHAWHLQHTTQPPVASWTHAAPRRAKPPRRSSPVRLVLATLAAALVAAGALLVLRAPVEPLHGAHVECHLTTDATQLPEGQRWFCTDMTTHPLRGDAP